jgi:hypothetical protein
MSGLDRFASWIQRWYCQQKLPAMALPPTIKGYVYSSERTLDCLSTSKNNLWRQSGQKAAGILNRRLWHSDGIDQGNAGYVRLGAGG